MITRLSDKKLLYIVKTMNIGGAEKFTLSLCEYFVKKCKKVTVISSGGIFVDYLVKLGIEHILVNPEYFNNKRNIFRLRASLVSIINRNNYDIIHCQHRLSLLSIRGIKHQAKIIYTAHNEFNDIYQKVLRPDIAIGISEGIYKNLQRYLSSSVKSIRKIDHGVKVNLLKKNYIDNRVINIGFIGRIIKEKGIYELIEAVKTLVYDNFPVKFIIRGSGVELPKIKELIIKYSLSGVTDVTENVIDEDKIYEGIDLLVLPTKMNEGFPISILEAAAHGIPSLCTNKGAITDFIEDNKNGFLLHNLQPELLAKKIKDICSDTNMFNKAAFNAYSKVKEHFNIDRMQREYEELYLSCLTG